MLILKAQDFYSLCRQYYYMCKLGCNDPVKTSTAFYVYIELCEGTHAAVCVQFLSDEVMARIIYRNLLTIYSETILGCQIQVQRGARFALFGGKKKRTLAIGNLYTLANQV